jgi:triosephosphate isomerase
MVNQSRQFFVGGNFKMNGSVKSVSDLIKGMNEAKLDGKTGESRLKASCFCSALEDTAKTRGTICCCMMWCIAHE